MQGIKICLVLTLFFSVLVHADSRNKDTDKMMFIGICSAALGLFAHANFYQPADEEYNTIATRLEKIGAIQQKSGWTLPDELSIEQEYEAKELLKSQERMSGITYTALMVEGCSGIIVLAALKVLLFPAKE